MGTWDAYLDPTASSFFAKGVSHDPATVDLIRRAVTTPVGPNRAPAFAKACASVNDLAYMISLATKPTVIVYRSDRFSPVFNAIEPTQPTQMTFRRLGEFRKAS